MVEAIAEVVGELRAISPLMPDDEQGGCDMAFPYNEKVLEHFRHPRNVGKMEDPTASPPKAARPAATWWR